MKRSFWMRTVDPRTKILIIFAMGAMVVASIPFYLEWSIMGILAGLFVLSGQGKTAVKIVLIYGISYALSVSESLAQSGYLGGIVVSFGYIFRRFMMPIVAGKYAISTTSIGNLMASLEKIKVPNQVTIPLAVMFRFFPTIREEFQGIRMAMEMRGIDLNVANVLRAPLKTMEYVFVPLLISTTKLGEELAAAAHTKGIEEPGAKVRYYETYFSIFDLFLGILMIGLIVLVLKSR